MPGILKYWWGSCSPLHDLFQNRFKMTVYETKVSLLSGSFISRAANVSVNDSGFAGHIPFLSQVYSSAKAATDECGQVPRKLYIETLNFEFYVIFTCHKIVSFPFVIQPLKNVKTILNPQALPKQAGQI